MQYVDKTNFDVFLRVEEAKKKLYRFIGADTYSLFTVGKLQFFDNNWLTRFVFDTITTEPYLMCSVDTRVFLIETNNSKTVQGLSPDQFLQSYFFLFSSVFLNVTTYAIKLRRCMILTIQNC